ncbi:MAG TPA: M1 family metallopeptidase [Anaerolineales bacterium]|nr:M1 family metallopeptidase [Anaerolineales bacterium]
MRRLHLLGLAAMVLSNLACATLVGGPSTARPTAPLPPTPASMVTARPSPTAPGASPTAVADATPLATLGPVQEAPVDLDVGLLPGVDLPEVNTQYAIDVTVTFNADGTATLTGVSRFVYTNHETAPISDLVLMLWPNNRDQYLSAMTLDSVSSAGRELELVAGGEGEIAQRFALDAPLPPGDSVDVSTAFSVEARPGIDDSGAARFGLTNDVLLAPTFYPLIPRRIDGDWDTQLAPPGGDTTNSDTATFVYVVRAPADLAIVGSGVVVDEQVEGDQRRQTLVAAPMRDLALVVGPLTRTSTTVDGVIVNAYLLERHAEYADDMLAFAGDQLRTLNQRVGPYPFTELDVIDAPGAFGGIEYPGEIFIGVVGPDRFFEVATVHEVGHQWFYSVVGDDQLREPWLDEAFASYSEVLYFEAKDGPEARVEYVADFRRYYEAVLSDAALPIGLPVDGYPAESDYYAAVYAKGAVFLDQLREVMGDDAFFSFLQATYTEHRFGFVTGQDVQARAEAACACELDGLFDEWVYGP